MLIFLFGCQKSDQDLEPSVAPTLEVSGELQRLTYRRGDTVKTELLAKGESGLVSCWVQIKPVSPRIPNRFGVPLVKSLTGDAQIIPVRWVIPADVMASTYLLIAAVKSRNGKTSDTLRVPFIVASGNHSQILVNPNPFVNQCTVSFDAQRDGIAKLTVHNSEDIPVITAYPQVRVGRNDVSINLHSLPAGTYRLTVELEDRTLSALLSKI